VIHLYLKRKFALVLMAAMFFTGCKSYSTELRIVLAASGPLIESLPLSPALKSGLVTDFTDMGAKTADLSDCLKAASDKPAKLQCVSTYEGAVEVIIQRGHFLQANNAKLNTVLGILRGIIASAAIYYGGRPAAGNGTVGALHVTESDLKRRIDDLRTAMQP
jgi:hypothetical protein